MDSVREGGIAGKYLCVMDMGLSCQLKIQLDDGPLFGFERTFLDSLSAAAAVQEGMNICLIARRNKKPGDLKKLRRVFQI